MVRKAGVLAVMFCMGSSKWKGEMHGDQRGGYLLRHEVTKAWTKVSITGMGRKGQIWEIL